MDHITQEHVGRNRQTRDGWELYATHRHRVTQLLTTAPRSAGDRLCLLGAGNSNDLDLNRLGSKFGAIHLVDLDAAALDFGMQQQRPAHADKFHQHGNVDVTGVASVIGNWSPHDPPSDREVEACLARSLDVPISGLPVECEVVASVGLLTQLIDSIVLAVGAHHRALLSLVQAIRLRHLRLLIELLCPGGQGYLITEVVSSVTYPQLSAVPDHELAATISSLINQRNFFTGTNPMVLRSLFETDAVMAPCVSGVEILAPGSGSSARARTLSVRCASSEPYPLRPKRGHATP